MDRLVLCLAIVLSLLATGCAESLAVDSGDVTDPFTSEDQVVETSDLAFEGPVKLDLDLLRLALARPSGTLPTEISLSDQSAVIVADLLYDGLTESVGDRAVLRPALAVEWSANDDFTEWRFVLDAERVAASDVATYFRALLAVEGNPAVTSLLADVASVEAVVDAEEEVVFFLDQPNAGFAWLLSGVGASFVGVDGAPTGRYRVVSDDDAQLILEPIAAAALLPEVAVHWSPSNRKAYDTLTLGLVDAAVGPARSLADAESRFGYVPPTRSILRFYGINFDAANLVDDRVRRAVLQAIDGVAITSEVGDGRAVPVDGVIAPSLAGSGGVGCASVCTAEPGTAENSIAVVVEERGGPLRLTLAFTGEEQAPWADAVAGDLGAVGFDVVVEEPTSDGLATAIVAGDADLFAYGWVAAAGSIDAVVPQLLASKSSENVLGFDTAEIDDLIARAALTGDDEQRWALLVEAHTLAMRQGRILPLSVARSHLIAAPAAAGLVIRADGSLDIEASR